MTPVKLKRSPAPCVLAVDMGSSSIRALLFDDSGRQLEGSETQLPHELITSPDGGSEADARALLDLTVQCIDGAVKHAADSSIEIGAVALTCFWHSLLGVDRNGNPTTPVLMWSDKRSGDDTATLRQRIDAETLHQETGCRPHSSYWPAKLLWLQRTNPEVFGSTDRWLSFADFVTVQLQGQYVTSLSMASGTGLFDTAHLTWHDDALAAAGVEVTAMSTLIDRGDPLPPLKPVFAQRWPALATIPWYPAIGDGAAANIGAGCVGSDRIAVTVGTSAAMRMIVEHGPTSTTREPIPERIWCYLLDRTHKVLGGALSNGGNVAEWLAQNMAGGEFEELTASAARLEPDAHGLTLLPFFAGERSPSWNDAATGTLSGIRLSTTPGHIFRASLEATAYRIAAIHDDLRPLAADGYEIHANGSAVLNSPLWLQIIADTLGRQVDAVDAHTEASAQGAAICALESLGVLEGLASVKNEISRSFMPDASAHERYARARERQSTLEHKLYGDRLPSRSTV